MIKVGTQNNEHGSPLYISSSDLKAHAHGIGASRAGKSKLIEYIARQFIKEHQGFCLIDPGGFLYQDLVQWLAYVSPSRTEIALIDPSYQKKVVGFDPLHIEGEKNEATISAKVDRIVALTTRALGMSDLASAPRLERVMRCLYYVLIEQDLSLEAVRFFLSPRYLHVRDAIIARTQSETIKDQWLMLTQGKRPEAYLNIVESTANRLFKVLTQPSVRRIIGVPENSINVRSMVDNRGAMLVNLQSSFAFSQDAAGIIGTFLVNEIWEALRKRTRDEMRTAPKFFLLIDEFQSFATPDFAQILDQGAKYGLHLLLFHQNLNQLDSEIRTAMTACHSRFVFGGVTASDAAQMLEGSLPTFEDLRQDIASVPSLPSRSYILRRPEQRLALAYTPEVHEYRVPEGTIERYVESITETCLSPEEVDELVRRAVPIPDESAAPPTESGNLNVKSQKLLTEGADVEPTADEAQEPSRQSKQPFRLTYETARGTPAHCKAQNMIARMGEVYQFETKIEQPIADQPGFVDVSLEKDGVRIACEVSVTTSAEWETKNVLKCLRAGYDHVWVIVSHPKKVKGVSRKILAAVPVAEQSKVKVLTNDDCLAELGKFGVPVDSSARKPIKLPGQRLDLKQAAELLGVSPSTMYRRVRARKVPFYRTDENGAYYFDRDELLLIGRFGPTGKDRFKVSMDKPLKIEKPKTKTKKLQDERYWKLLDLD